VSQGTVRKAIDELAAENLVVRRQGKGTFVATHAEAACAVPLPEADAGQRGPAAKARPSANCGLPARARQRRRGPRLLELRTGDAVLQIRRVLSFRRRAHHSGRHLAAGRCLQGLTAERLPAIPGPMYAMFEAEFGVRMVRAEEKIRAVSADAADAGSSC
jgi:GntR family transcriptional regulator